MSGPPNHVPDTDDCPTREEVRRARAADSERRQRTVRRAEPDAKHEEKRGDA